MGNDTVIFIGLFLGGVIVGWAITALYYGHQILNGMRAEFNEQKARVKEEINRTKKGMSV